MNPKDREILRDLARRYQEIAHKDIQDHRRDLWRKHNNLHPVPPPIYVRAFAWSEMPEARCQCEDPVLREIEDYLRQSIFRDGFNDDWVIEPWVTVEAAFVTPADRLWGPCVGWFLSDDPRGAKMYDPPLRDPEDIRLLVRPRHEIDEAATALRLEKVHDAIGDLVTINADRGPLYRMWNADISAQLARLRGLEQLMWDMKDRPAWLHTLLCFMRDGILQVQEEAEVAGDWKLCNHQNQAIAYAEELADPIANGPAVKRDDLWCFCASQELAQVGPRLFYEFMLQYQLPIISKFGLVAYGCCEDLTLKIPLLRQIPNLRRVSVALTANVARCAEQIGRDYVFSYRPNPAEMVGYHFDEDYVANFLRRDLTLCRDCYVDITLKDVETVECDPSRVRRWVAVARRVIDEVWQL